MPLRVRLKPRELSTVQVWIIPTTSPMMGDRAPDSTEQESLLFYLFIFAILKGALEKALSCKYCYHLLYARRFNQAALACTAYSQTLPPNTFDIIMEEYPPL